MQLGSGRRPDFNHLRRVPHLQLYIDVGCFSHLNRHGRHNRLRETVRRNSKRISARRDLRKRVLPSGVSCGRTYRAGRSVTQFDFRLRHEGSGGIGDLPDELTGRRRLRQSEMGGAKDHR